MSEKLDSLDEIRDHIDSIDKQISILLALRAKLSVRAGELKRAQGSPIQSPEREAEILASAFERGEKSPLGGERARHVFEAIIKACRDVQDVEKKI